jgi:hypothetical protein
MVGKTFALKLVLMCLSLKRLIIIAALLVPNLIHAYDFAIQEYFPSFAGQVSGDREDPDKPGAKLFVLLPVDLRVYVARTENFAFGAEGGVSFVFDGNDSLKTVYSYGGFNISHIRVDGDTGIVEYDWYLTLFPLYELDFLRFRYKAALEIGYYFFHITVENQSSGHFVDLNFSFNACMVFSKGIIPFPLFGLTVTVRMHNNNKRQVFPKEYIALK